MSADGKILWDEAGAPHSRRFDDRYFSAGDGRAETFDVFMRGNGLPERWQAGARFRIAELGFGTGLNVFVTVQAFLETAPTDAQLNYTAFELYPLSSREMRRALAPWPDLQALAAPLLDGLSNNPVQKFEFGPVRLRLILGDARQTVPASADQADAWYLDGFAPSKNPELWEAELMQAVCDRTAPGGTFSTYTAAGFVRRNLLAAGFSVEKVPGFKGKRERLQGLKLNTQAR